VPYLYSYTNSETGVLYTIATAHDERIFQTSDDGLQEEALCESTY